MAADYIDFHLCTEVSISVRFLNLNFIACIFAPGNCSQFIVTNKITAK